MAGSGGVWGIDIGQCGLKALRCTLADDGDSLVAEAFDFIEYPKILSQPDANPDELVRDALKQFLSRNPVRGIKIAISVSGQSGLARFIKLPPVESKKIPDIVKYEARQQIPFSLEDVVWDYQQMPGGSEEEGFSLETEVGLFAMKRDQVFRTIRPLVDAEVELDIIQLTPLCIYNAVAFDLLSEQDQQDYDPDNAPESLVVLSMGTDTSDLVVTNGFRVWQRSIPLGGNHFTKQLMKDMKLTFAKAEHLKRNAREAEDPKAVFQAMRSVFGDLVTEVQRSIGYFQNIDKTAKVGRVIVLGNAARLPGLPQYLGKNLGNEVVSLASFDRLTGSSVTSSPAFKDNVLSFAVCYGLCLQGVGRAKLSTNLVPREIIVQRLIRRKKPWAVAIVGIMLLACTFHFFFSWNAWRAVHDDLSVGGTTWQDVKQGATSLETLSNQYTSEDEKQVAELTRLNQLGEEAVATSDGRLLWLELIKAINAALPRDPDVDPGALATPKLEQRPLSTRREVYIQHIESEYKEDLEVWFDEDVQNRYKETLLAKQRVNAGIAPVDASAPATPPSDPSDAPTDPAGATSPDGGVAEDSGAVASSGDEIDLEGVVAPQGPGWVIELKLLHYHNDSSNPPTAAEYVRREFVANLVDGTVELPASADGSQSKQYTFEELGIKFPIIAYYDTPRNIPILDPNYEPEQDPTATQLGANAFASEGANDEKAYIKALGCECFVQFCWQPTRASEREEKRLEEQSGTTEGGDVVSAP